MFRRAPRPVTLAGHDQVIDSSQCPQASPPLGRAGDGEGLSVLEELDQLIFREFVLPGDVAELPVFCVFGVPAADGVVEETKHVSAVFERIEVPGMQQPHQVGRHPRVVFVCSEELLYARRHLEQASQLDAQHFQRADYREQEEQPLHEVPLETSEHVRVRPVQDVAARAAGL
jgi:hypothetical protein